MSLMKENSLVKEEVQRILLDIGAIKRFNCNCDAFFTRESDSSVYARVFSILNKNNSCLDTKLVQESIEEILNEGIAAGSKCPQCGYPR